ncbi:AAA family ATPase [Rhizomonospora bruguierae]|uniref:AAA family ATPase n=1 Tax=Rhizomonospora bruguierae TaxID=1581705 RepID=UPI001BCCCE00|nr:SMC family ATPase [Micromonospora sp. NBRC 107566]
MRPLRLDLAGFTVFREETTVDFTDTDFFALVGPTGSGKSTVLDAICFALYGTVPRWGDKRAIVNALTPSASEARVRLVFESAGARYVATRVVRRDGKGRVFTGGAALEQLPPGFDVRKFDTGLTPEDLGEVLAGTVAEMDEAVLAAVGLPYDQFTSCVVLPQGEFAEFLHAKPATRQQILVNLLGLHVYERIRVRAGERASTADAKLAAVDRMLDGLAEAGDEAVAEAAERVAAMRALAGSVEAAMPRVAAAAAAVAATRDTLADLDAEIALLAAVRAPAEAGRMAAAITAARSAAADAADAVGAAEEREEKLRGELAGAGDPAALRLLLAAHTERERLDGQATALAATLAEADAEHEKAEKALARARTRVAQAHEALEAARAAYQEAQTADRAAAIRAHLVAGQPCPVCEQTVGTVPAVHAKSAVAAAEAAGKKARAVADKADEHLAGCDRAVRELETALAGTRAQHTQLTARLAELDERLAGAPGPEALRRDLAAIEELRRGLEEASAAVRSAREAHRRARGAVEAAEERLRGGWRAFDASRDGVAKLGPPAAERDDLAAAWSALTGWASGAADTRRAERGAAEAAVAAAEEGVAAVRAQIEALFEEAGLAVPAASTPGGGQGRGSAAAPGGGRARGSAAGGRGHGAGNSGADDARYARAAHVAVERAEGEQRRLADRREQAERLREQRAEHERQSRVAKALGTHLRANNFERWLLAEALDLLVDGASRILRELSGGQYDLVHDKGEFFVVDHHDAGLRRAVRTLSGGETFQASLALALALSEQLAGLSSNAASLESILLDEGFGTLDATTLDTVAVTLETLAARGDRMVGVVTHVGALADRIPVRFEVTKDARSARIRRVGM